MKFISKKDKTGIARVSRCKNILRHKAWVKLGVFVLVAMGMQTAQACPIVTLLSQVDRVSPILNFPIIYFCKQSFNPELLLFKPTEAQLLTGGSQVISMGNAPIQTFPLSNSVNLSGFTPSQLNLNNLSSNLPISGGQYDTQSVFNFYAKVTNSTDCYKKFGIANTNYYDRIMEYLRANPSIFQANGGAQTGVSLNSDNNIAIIKNVPIAHDTLAGSNLTANIKFYYANDISNPKQWFTNTALSSRYCWVGVSSKMEIQTDSNPPKYSGDYVVDVGVLTQ